MFTGIITRLGTVAELGNRPGGRILAVEAERWERPLELGESIAVQGVCLTLAGEADGRMRFDVLQETLDCTSLGGLDRGDAVNLERALRYGDPLGGHLVSGHVDGTGAVREIEAVGGDRRIDVDCAPALLDGMVHKGSICVDGISLTLAGLTDSGFSVHIIPHTWEQTSLHRLAPGAPLNLEVDLAGKFIRRMAERGVLDAALSWERLRKEGFSG